MQLEPYLFFYGRCEEALEFYKTAIGGTFEINRYAGSPMEEHVPEDFRQKVMHATFNGNGFTFMAADGRPGKSLDADAGNISLSLTTSDDSEGTRIFNALAADGEITMALEPQFWGGKFGQVVDKFATEWMISIR